MPDSTRDRTVSSNWLAEFVEEVVEVGGDVPIGAGFAEVSCQGPGSLHGFEEFFAVLAHERVAQLVPEAPDVGAQRCVGWLGSATGSDGGH